MRSFPNPKIGSATEPSASHAQGFAAVKPLIELDATPYRSGLSDYLDVIDAERSLYQSQMSHVNLVVQQYINYVTLCKALGGGWAAAMQN